MALNLFYLKVNTHYISLHRNNYLNLLYTFDLILEPLDINPIITSLLKNGLFIIVNYPIRKKKVFYKMFYSLFQYLYYGH